MSNLHDASEFVAGPGSHYIGDYRKARHLGVLEDTTLFPDELVPTGTGPTAAEKGIHYANDTQAATTITPTTTFRERKTQQHGVVGTAVTDQSVTVTTSYAGITLEKLAAAWHAEIVTIDADRRRLRPLGRVRYMTLVVDGPSVEDHNGIPKRNRLIVPKVANTGEVALTWDDENDTLLEVTWTAYKPDNADGDDTYWIVEGPAFPDEDDDGIPDSEDPDYVAGP